MVQLDYRDAKPIYEQIKQGLRRLVVSHAILENEKLPSVRELASSLAINPNTIQRAYKELEAEGYIYSAAGKGSFAAPASETTNMKKNELLSALDKTLVELFDLGVTETELIDHIKEVKK